jgi:hypothetical protein
VSSDEASLFVVSFLLGSSGFNELSGSLFSSVFDCSSDLFEASSEDTKSQQQTSTLEAPQKPQNKPLIKLNNQTPNKKDGSVVIYKVVSSDEASLFVVSFLLGSSGFNELSGSLFSSVFDCSSDLFIDKKETTNREASSEDTKSQQQTSTLEAPQKPQSKPLIKLNNQTPNKKDGSVVIYKVGTDNIITIVASSPMPLTCPVTLTLKPFFSLLMSPCILIFSSETTGPIGTKLGKIGGAWVVPFQIYCGFRWLYALLSGLVLYCTATLWRQLIPNV